jgi:2-oxo-3-hexenedioate decarboxylase
VISAAQEEALARRLMDAYDRAAMLPPLSADTPELDVPGAYRVLARIEHERIAQGWQPVGRKIGFTNTTIWPRYGVYQPMWARVWSHTVHDAPDGTATLSLAGLVQPRIEPEVVFGIAARPALRGEDAADLRAALDAIAWIAPGFEIVQSHYPEWKFTAADCTAAFGLHGALVVGPRTPLDASRREELHASLPQFRLALRRDGHAIDEGVGSNVLGGPVHALVHLVRVLAAQPEAAPLGAGEIVTTGTITDAWPVAAGETWQSDYGTLGIPGLRVTLT